MSETNSTGIIPVDDLFAQYAEIKNGYSKSGAIVASSSAIASTIASSLLILTILRSPKRLSTTYHRLLLGMSISDILYSLTLSTFNTMIPIDVSYIVWNAKGNQATCTAEGFLTTVGIAATLCYSCALNLYYLAMVKHNKTDTYIRTKIEPFLHGIPIFIALAYGITQLINKNYNNSGVGTCSVSPIYNPPHCEGYDEGVAREGFEIPCGRGSNRNLYLLSGLLLLFAPLIIMCVSLGMIYRSVVKQEQRIARYGAGALNPSAHQTSGDDGSDRANKGNIRGSRYLALMISSITSRFWRRESSGVEDHSNSRAVVHKARAYTIAYLLTWGWTFIAGIILGITGEEVADLPLAFLYMWRFMNPLQGLFNFLVYLHPKVMKAKRSPGQNISWCQALGIAFWSGINGPNKKTNTPPARVAHGNDENSPHQDGDNKKNSPAVPDDERVTAAVATDIAANTTSHQAKYNHNSTDIEEEKTEIRAPEDNDDWDDNNALESNEM